eukprot:jgi/Mesen1/6266/ME000324S05309
MRSFWRSSVRSLTMATMNKDKILRDSEIVTEAEESSRAPEGSNGPLPSADAQGQIVASHQTDIKAPAEKMEVELARICEESKFEAGGANAAVATPISAPAAALAEGRVGGRFLRRPESPLDDQKPNKFAVPGGVLLGMLAGFVVGMGFLLIGAGAALREEKILAKELLVKDLLEKQQKKESRPFWHV